MKDFNLKTVENFGFATVYSIHFQVVEGEVGEGTLGIDLENLVVGAAYMEAYFVDLEVPSFHLEEVVGVATFHQTYHFASFVVQVWFQNHHLEMALMVGLGMDLEAPHMVLV